MIVCIAEKPSVAREIADVLGAKDQKDGYIEGNGYQVTWAYGHLCQLKTPGELNPSWKKWNLSYLPMMPKSYAIELIPGKRTTEQFNIIKKLYKRASEIVNCGDAGQEGELIQRWIMQLAGVRCPVKRLWISSLTEESIREGFRSLKDQGDYDHLYEAGLARAQGDWLLGMNASRLYTLKYGDNGTVLSIGRVQTPTLAMIVSRDKVIESFRPQPYWTISTKYRNVVFNSLRGRMTDPQESQVLLRVMRQHIFVVDDIQQKECQEQPPQLFDLTALQVFCNKKYGMSAAATLNTLQSLYEKKLTTYPRVDTRFLTHDIYPKCKAILEKLLDSHFDGAPYVVSDAIRSLLASGEPLRKSNRVFDDSKVTDHHALMPTGVVHDNLTDNERRVFFAIVHSFVAVFMSNSVYSQTIVLGHVGEEKFKATGKTVVSPGWHSLYEDTSESEDGGNNDEKPQVLPSFNAGERGNHEPSLQKKMTTPPKRFTEATLLQAMETAGKLVDDEALREAMKENGIGRPSSRAGIIEMLLARKYITRQKKNLVSTQTGRKLIETIREPMLKDAATTGQWERKLRLIEKGEFTLGEFMSELESQIRVITDKVKSDTVEKNITLQENVVEPNRKAMTQARRNQSGAKLLGKQCPFCGIGYIRKGPAGYYCTNQGRGCDAYKKLNG